MTDKIGFNSVPEGFDVPGFMPERIAWKPREGLFVNEFEEELPLPLIIKTVGAVMIYSCWSDTIGSPHCQAVGQCCGERQGCSEGIRIGFFLIDSATGQIGDACYTDFYGLAKKAGQRIVKLSMAHGPILHVSRVQTIGTKNGQFKIPISDIPDDRSLADASS